MTTVVLLISLLSPVRLYFQADQPVTIDLSEKTAVAKLVLLSPANAKEKEVAAPKGASFDLAEALPGIWDGKTHYVQALDATGKAVGSPLVVVPLWPPDPGLREHVRQSRMGKPMGLRIYPEKRAVLETTDGPITVAFSPEAAPNSVANFMHLVEGGMYTNVPFHRILPGFMIQGGDPTGSGMGGPGYFIDLEASEKPHKPGVLSMARSSNPNSAGCQFFICLGAPSHLNGQYTAFGHTVEGMDVVKKIGATPLADPRAGKPVKAPKIQRAKLVPAPPRKPVG